MLKLQQRLKEIQLLDSQKSILHTGNEFYEWTNQANKDVKPLQAFQMNIYKSNIYEKKT